METVNVFDAQTRLSRLFDQAVSGEDVILSRNGRPVARITQLATAPKRKIKYGLSKVEFVVPDDFDAPSPDEVLAGFVGR